MVAFAFNEKPFITLNSIELIESAVSVEKNSKIVNFISLIVICSQFKIVHHHVNTVFGFVKSLFHLCITYNPMFSAKIASFES